MIASSRLAGVAARGSIARASPRSSVVIDNVAPARFRRAIDDHGPDAFGMFSCSKATNEVNYVAQKFARVVVGSNNIDSCNRT